MLTLRHHHGTRVAITDLTPDVLEVLMTEYKTALIRKGFRRVEINEMYKRAKDQLETERNDPKGKC